MKNFEYFQNKETVLKSAIQKVENKLSWFKENQNSLSESILDTWNNYHDLHDRLIDRLSDNYFEYSQWHFNTHGYCFL